MKITDLNPSGGIGANCLLLEVGAFRIVVDAGFHPKKTGYACLPDLHKLGTAPIQLVVLTHCHLDHLGAIPLLLRQFPDAWLLMSLPSQMLYQRMLHNSVNIMSRLRMEANIMEYPLYTHGEVDRLKNRVVPMLYERSRTFESAGDTLDITFYPAGHVPGGSALQIVHQKRRFFITGDVLFAPQRIVGGCRFPKQPFDLVVTETTRGATERISGRDRASETTRLLETIEATLTAKGSVLIPAFAFGRMQEILAILHEGRRKRKIPEVPIFGSGLGMDLVNYFDEIARKTNLLSFRKSIVKELQVRDLPDKLPTRRAPWPKPSIYVLSSGMMVENTPSYHVAAGLLEDMKNSICFVGYCDPDTPGGQLLAKKDGQKMVFDSLDQVSPIEALVERFDLTSHADRHELLEYAREVYPRAILLTHGEEPARTWFKTALQDTVPRAQVIDPLPGETYSLLD